MSLLFTTIGIAAGDFFSVNLSAITSGLRMSDTFAGVTFLALGNGSPDIFSTFAAMNSNSSSMAIGELIGAASFITTVVAGSMALVQPFNIKRNSFVRDVAFLLTAIIFLLLILVKGRLELWECIAMIVIYVIYVVFVMLYHLYMVRSKSSKQEDDSNGEDGNITSHASNATAKARNEHEPLLQQREHQPCRSWDDSQDEWFDLPREAALTYDAMRGWCRGTIDAHRNAPYHIIQPSLAGTLAFRRERALERQNKLQGRQDTTDSNTTITRAANPEELHEGQVHIDESISPQSWYSKIWRFTCQPLKTLFPVLSDSKKRPLWHWIFDVATAPSIFLLKITVPVVDSQEGDHPASQDFDSSAGQGWDRWLLVLQGFVAPQVILATILLNSGVKLTHPGATPVYCLAASVFFAVLVLVSSKSSKKPRWYPALSVVGFIIGAFWISVMADEVVGILKAFGIFFNISEAILGFTVFPIGNSMDDLVADVTVAQHGHPVMALSACYGGPMLNILLGIGISGLYQIFKATRSSGRLSSLTINVDVTSIISIGTLAATLVALLAVMVWRGWRIDKKIGIGLIIMWIACTVANLVVELS